jgi:hypothetical protein
MHILYHNATITPCRSVSLPILSTEVNAPKNGVSSLLVLLCIPKSLSDSVLRAEQARQRTGRLERAVAVRDPLLRNALVIRPKTLSVLFSVECALD